MSWLDTLTDKAERFLDIVFDHDSSYPPPAERPRTRGWSCKRCKHKNPHAARYCGGCAREKGSPV